MVKLAIPVIHITNKKSAQAFYCNQLGFQAVFAYEPFGDKGPCYMGLIRDRVTIHLSTFPEDSVCGSAVVLIVEDVDALYKEFSSKQVIIDLLPTDQSWGNREMYIKDPDGNSIRFTQWKNE